MIENALLKYLGIYPETIKRIDDMCERVCEDYGIDSDEEVWPEIKRQFGEICGIRPDHSLNITDILISMAFREVAGALVEHGMDNGRIDWCVDGMASAFTIDGEEV